MNHHQSSIVILIVAVPLIASVFIPVVGWWKKGLCYPIVLTAIAASFVLSLLADFQVVESGPLHYYLGGWEPPWGIEYRIDHLSAYMALLLTFITLMVAIYSKRSIQQEIPEKEVHFYCIFLLLVTGLLGIVCTGDIFNLYVFLEITSLSAYALIAIGEKRAPFSAFKYVIMGTIGACFYLLSVGYLYIITGSLNMADLARILPDLYQSKIVIVAFSFLVIGVSIKIALFPLHGWLPDAYTHAPSSVSALIAPTMTKVGAFILIRMMFLVFEPRFYVEILPATDILSWMGATAMIMGSIFAIAQSDLKRMLAYSSIAQIGYIVLGVGLANQMGLTGGMLHIVNHAFMKGCLFLVAGAIIYRTGTQNINEFKNLYIKMPYTTAAFTIAAFSMIGIPPTCGFFSKFYLILGSIDAGNWVFVGLILLSSVLNLIYFINVIRLIYFANEDQKSINGEPLIDEPVRNEAPLSMLIPTLTLAVGILLLGIFNGEIIETFLESAIPADFAR
jgi:multicomponent Na+:H+ antiporter subunit D